MERILIISTNREMAPQPAVPIGAAWVAEALHQAGFQVGLLDLCFEDDPLRAVAGAIAAFNPDGIGISVRNLDNCDFLSPISFLPGLKRITDLVKVETGAPVLLGGAGVSVMPLAVLEYLGLDHAVAGEGEEAAVDFFRCDTMAEASALPGIIHRGSGEKNDYCRLRSIAVMPQLHRWADFRRYLKLEPVLPVQGKRGCANRCLYCTYNKIEGESWRLRDPAAVAEEISAAMRETGAREFEFVDSVFNEPEGYLEALLEEILGRRLKVRLRVSSLSPKGLTRAQLRLMERAGVTSVVITPETASGVTLAALGKGFGEDDVARAAELFACSSIRVLWCFLLGAPKEDERTLGKTIDFINAGMAKKDAAFITAGIRIYPGTGLHELAIKEGVVAPSDNLLMPTFYFSQSLDLQKAMLSLREKIIEPSRCIFVSDTRSSSLTTLRRMGTALHLPSPFWRYAGYFNRMTANTRVINRNWSISPANRK